MAFSGQFLAILFLFLLILLAFCGFHSTAAAGAALLSPQSQLQPCDDENNSSCNVYLEADRKALLALTGAAAEQNGSYWYNLQWPVNENVSSSPCSWAGITCSPDAHGFQRVTGLNLNGAKLKGEPSQGFSALTALTSLELAQNSFNGQVPPDLGKCMALQSLNLSSNFLHGPLLLRNLSKLQILDVAYNRLGGNLSQVVPDNCQDLQELRLAFNQFTGSLQQLQRCSALTHLDLTENNVSGTLWPKLGAMEEVYLSSNALTGNISEEIFLPQQQQQQEPQSSCNLRRLDLSQNNLTGTIPRGISHCKSLERLDLSFNYLHGPVPAELGLLPNLQVLMLVNNSFSREIPQELTRCSQLSVLDLGSNGFGGAMQPLFSQLKSLVFLRLPGNSYGPAIDPGIFELSLLHNLDLSDNNFTGPVPQELVRLTSLRFLNLAGNAFSGRIPAELGAVRSLETLDLSYNRLTGAIPASVGNLSSLLWLMLAGNRLSGSLPREIGRCQSLYWLNVADNNLSGRLPEELGNMGSNATAVFQYNSRFSELIPLRMATCQALARWVPANYSPFSFVLQTLNPMRCTSQWQALLQGQGTKIPTNCRNANKINSSNNNNSYSSNRSLSFTSGYGDVPSSGYLQLSGNNLEGPIPRSLGKMRFVSLIILSNNRIDGRIPEEIANLDLIFLNLSYNKLSGTLPTSLSQLNCLLALDLSYNNFSGSIPASYAQLSELEFLNVSHNSFLTGPVPCGGQFDTFDASSYLGDGFLCLQTKIVNGSCLCSLTGNVNASNHHHHEGHRLNLLPLCIGFLAMPLCAVSLYIGFWHKAGEWRYSSKRDEEELFTVAPATQKMVGARLSMADIKAATDNFSEANIIGTGGFGTVYKGHLSNGTMVAVKRLHREATSGLASDLGSDKESESELRALRVGAHGNLVPLLAWRQTSNVFVYELAERGTLQHWLRERPGHLPWARRLRIAWGVAQALAHLHHGCRPAIIHRDLTTANILLDRRFRARVSDFGLARTLHLDGGGPASGDLDATHVSTVLAGTLGYVAPEYPSTWRATTKGDVYSFGVVLLELVTGRCPLLYENGGGDDEDGDYEGAVTLVEWVSSLCARRLEVRALDPVLVREQKRVSRYDDDGEEAERVIVSAVHLLHVGRLCTLESPYRRPTMLEVLSMLPRM